MIRFTLILVALLVAVAIGWAWRGDPAEPLAADADFAVVGRGAFEVVSVHDGLVESRRVISVSSRFQGAATLVELVPEGSRVEAGTVLARFDASEVETRVRKLEQDLAIARTELRSFEQARAPLQAKELELALAEAGRKLAAEQRYLEDSEALLKDAMVSAQEVEQQRRKVRGLAAEVERARLAFELTRDFLHPAELDKATSAVLAAEQSLAIAREQVAHSTVRAPADGVVVYKPLSLGNEFRRARVGDALYPNQPFLVLPDMDDLVVVLDVPESELQHVREGAAAVLQPLAFPDLQLSGRVEQVGVVAQSVPGRAEWQKYFHVVVGLDQAGDRVRPGMSVIARIVSYRAEDVLQVPRRAVHWRDGVPQVQVATQEGTGWRTVTLGRANLASFEVDDGLVAGERVLLH